MSGKEITAEMEAHVQSRMAQGIGFQRIAVEIHISRERLQKLLIERGWWNKRNTKKQEPVYEEQQEYRSHLPLPAFHPITWGAIALDSERS